MKNCKRAPSERGSLSLKRMRRIHRADLEVQFAALSVATDGAAPGEVPGSGRMFPAASVS